MHHKFKLIVKLYKQYFVGCENLKDFIKAVNVIAGKEFERTDEAPGSGDKIKGDIFEIFCHFYIMERGSSHETPINKDSFQYAESENDYGVDGEGINENGDRVTIQSKFRSNPLDLITYEEVAKCIAQSIIKYGVQPAKETIVFITTANDYNDNVKNAIPFERRPKLINFDQIDRESRNKDFWQRWLNFLI